MPSQHGGPTVAPLADPHTALWAIMVAFLWRFAGFNMVVYVAAIQGLPREYYDYAVLEGAGRFHAAFRGDGEGGPMFGDVCMEQYERLKFRNRVDVLLNELPDCW